MEIQCHFQVYQNLEPKECLLFLTESFVIFSHTLTTKIWKARIYWFSLIGSRVLINMNLHNCNVMVFRIAGIDIFIAVYSCYRGISKVQFLFYYHLFQIR